MYFAIGIYRWKRAPHICKRNTLIIISLVVVFCYFGLASLTDSTRQFNGARQFLFFLRFQSDNPKRKYADNYWIMISTTCYITLLTLAPSTSLSLSLSLPTLHTPFCYLRQMQQMFIVDKSFNKNAHYKRHLLNYYAHTIELTSHRHIQKK